LPHELQQRVADLRHQWNRGQAIELACLFVAALVGLLLLVSFVDYALRISDRGSRVLLSLAFTAGVLAIGWRVTRTWWQRRWNDFAAAQQVQRTFPQLGDRLASSLEFLKQDEDDPAAGSARMRRAVVADTTAAVETLAVEEVVESKTRRRSLIAAVVAGLLTLGFCVAAPHAVRTALARVAMPWTNVEWPRRNDLTFVDPPTLLARGDNFEASLFDNTGELPSEVEVEYRYEVDGRTRHEQTWMQRVGDRAVARRENVQRTFEYRATGGDHHTMAWTKVEVVDPPGVEQLELLAHPPTYSGLSAGEITLPNRVLSGTEIGVAGAATTPLQSATISAVNTSLGEDLVLTAKLDGDDPQHFRLAPSQLNFSAESTPVRASIRLELVAKNGLKNSIALGDLTLIPDRPPKFTWVHPSKDMSLLPTAVLPLEANASDDLAIKDIFLPLRVVKGTSDEPIHDNRRAVFLYNGNETPPARKNLPAEGESLNNQTLIGDLSFETLELSAGVILEIRNLTFDYLPQEGDDSEVRRITIISQDELDSLLAEAQSDILRLLEQALADQRTAQRQAAQLATANSAGSSVTRENLDWLVSARLAQQNTRRTLLADKESVVDRVRSMLDQLAINRLDRVELSKQLSHILQQVASLAEEPLPTAEQRITDLRKQLDTRIGGTTTESQATLARDTSSQLNSSQQVVIRTLEELIDRAGDWSDADRFIRELARLEQEQRELRDATLAAARKQLTARANRAGEGVEPAELAQLESAQGDLSRRFEKLAATMSQSVEQDIVPDADTDGLEQRLADALAEAETSNLAGLMAEGRRQIGSEQLGRATDSQGDAADKLRELVEMLRDRQPTDPAELASKLRELQQELNNLADAAEGANSQNDREELAEQLDRLARELKRMTAQAASENTSQAGQSAAPKPGESPADAQENMQQAKDKIKQAQQDLAQRIAELEQEKEQSLLDRLALVLDDLIPRQQQILEQTLQLEYQRETESTPEPASTQAGKLATTEAKLSQDLLDAISDLTSRAVFQLALRSASEDMQQAAEALEQSNTGRVTQSLELGALARMRHVLEVLRAPPPQPDEEESQAGDSGAGEGGGQQPQQPPLIELAEVKMLRWLQADLNGRTRLYEADLADNRQQADAKREASERLSTEQQSLTELVREMLRRNNRNARPEIDL